MSNSAITPFLSYLGWSFLPNLATSFVQSLYYRLTLRAGTAPPRPGTPQFARDYRRVRIFVLTLYLIYTILQSLYDIKLRGDFYTLLSISPYTTTDREIKSKFRRLAAKFHPDKLANSHSPSDPTDAKDAHFLHLRLASETLTNPSTRYAYTHFGPHILSVLPSTINPQTNERIHLPTSALVILALKQKLPSYILSLAFVYVLNTFLLPTRRGQFWRYLVIAVSAVLELHLLTHEIGPLPEAIQNALGFLRHNTALGAIVPPHLLPFQILSISQNLALSLNIFISQVAAVLPQTPSLNDSSNVTPFLQQLNNALSTSSVSAQGVDREALGLLGMQFAPFRGDEGQVSQLRRGMKDWMMLGVGGDGGQDGNGSGNGVRDAVRRAMRRREELESREKGEKKGVRQDGDEVVELLNSDVQL